MIMIINFDEIEETILPRFNGGEKEFKAKMLVDKNNKILYGKLEPGASIGMHTHDTSSEIIYFLKCCLTAEKKPYRQDCVTIVPKAMLTA
ncbi:hypothetical protein [Lacrimispora sphenoides]|uniref:Cupin domain-containing protein n=1 Tax=Lacrimispora sphenoides JCM 1415 TaxID=1297793 RepID=A0ABY1C5A8_9FIRM|nr:hypothetical protein [Lacrimispora sphenoides]SET68801.1 hypothetical protein SAMN02745906_1126 [[Clostridium] sphenoides JCM 1415]SUY50497.1 Cupin domain [Lacrimispora sphenoides]